MKYLIIPLLFLTLLSVFSCQEKVDIETEKQAIINVLYEEGAKFAANDTEGVYALHIQDDLATRFSEALRRSRLLSRFRGWR